VYVHGFRYKIMYTHHATVGATVNSRGAGAATEVRAVVPAGTLPQTGTNRVRLSKMIIQLSL